jgi:hypothetical protein
VVAGARRGHPADLLHSSGHSGSQFSNRKMGYLGRSADEVGTGPQAGSQLPDDGTQPTPEPIALDSSSDFATDGIGDPGRHGIAVLLKRYRERTATGSRATPERGEGGPVPNSPRQADRR